MGEIERFQVAFPEAALVDLKERLRRTRWPERETVGDWSQGAPLDKVRELCRYWGDGYDWRRCERQLNQYEHYRTAIEGLRIHFMHVRSPHEDALPLVMTHGWPGSIIEFLKVIGPLTNPTAHGGKASDAFHLVLPSLPGYGFSDKPSSPGWGLKRIGNAWIALMRRLGYQRFVAQGGDWGSGVTTAIGLIRPPECLGIHLNMAVIIPTGDFGEPTPAEQAAMDSFKFYNDFDSGYAKLQGTRPQTVGYGLTDSPAAQAAWIYEKFHAWTDNEGAPEDALGRDEMLDNITLYWLTETATSSARLYWESMGSFLPRKLDLPVGISIFPKEITRPSRRWAEPYWSNIIHWNELPRGGHFAAFEQPELFVDEVRTCFSKLR